MIAVSPIAPLSTLRHPAARRWHDGASRCTDVDRPGHLLPDAAMTVSRVAPMSAGQGNLLPDADMTVSSVAPMPTGQAAGCRPPA
jgi:hypothetical protein